MQSHGGCWHGAYVQYLGRYVRALEYGHQCRDETTTKKEKERLKGRIAVRTKSLTNARTYSGSLSSVAEASTHHHRSIDLRATHSQPPTNNESRDDEVSVSM